MTGLSRRAIDLVAPETPFQTAVSAHRRVAFGSLPLDDVKMIKKTFGCTVNDVVMALCAAGLRYWLDERGELPAEPLLGVIPVSVRTREQMGTFGNQVSAMTVELPTNVADPGQRLRRVSETMNAAKERHRALPASLMQDVNDLIPPALFSHAVRAMSQATATPGYQSASQPDDLQCPRSFGAGVPRRSTAAGAVPDRRGKGWDRPEHHCVQLPGFPRNRHRRRPRAGRRPVAHPQRPAGRSARAS